MPKAKLDRYLGLSTLQANMANSRQSATSSLKVHHNKIEYSAENLQWTSNSHNNKINITYMKSEIVNLFIVPVIQQNEISFSCWQ